MQIYQLFEDSQKNTLKAYHDIDTCSIKEDDLRFMHIIY